MIINSMPPINRVPKGLIISNKIMEIKINNNNNGRGSLIRSCHFSIRKQIAQIIRIKRTRQNRDHQLPSSKLLIHNTKVNNQTVTVKKKSSILTSKMSQFISSCNKRVSKQWQWEVTTKASFPPNTTMMKWIPIKTLHRGGRKWRRWNPPDSRV